MSTFTETRANELNLNRVAKRFAGDTNVPPVLDGIDLNVSSGEFVAIVGASGCGKSTWASVSGSSAVSVAQRRTEHRRGAQELRA
jgi:ABC-type nitrate/sulfonate/bicarbonate transport system ATPase subunit